jgi:uncharacterized membrane protein YfcA
MLETVFGLPTHILVIHAAVALVPVASLVTVVVAAWARWRRRLAWWVVGLDVVTVGVVVAARETGERFYALLGQPAAAAQHAELGKQMLWFAVGLLVVALLVALVRYRRDAVSTAVGLLAVVVAAASIVWVVRVGDSGSRAVWKGVVDSRLQTSGASGG